MRSAIATEQSPSGRSNWSELDEHFGIDEDIRLMETRKVGQPRPNWPPSAGDRTVESGGKGRELLAPAGNDDFAGLAS
jgi:hypothetical protein